MSQYEVYDGKTVRKAMNACSQTPTGIRDASMIHTMWCTGIRCAEACDLREKDIDRDAGTIWIASGKGGRCRLVVLPKMMCADLWKSVDKWIAVRTDLAWRGSTLFCSMNGSRLDESYVRRMFSETASRAGLGKRFHPHGLRHTFAVKMHLSGVPLDVIQRQLGHSDLAVTGRYLRRIGPETVKRIMDNFSVE
jgi:site-specific recombinase XerD